MIKSIIINKIQIRKAIKNTMTLKELKIGESAVIKSVGGSGALRQHFLDM